MAGKYRILMGFAALLVVVAFAYYFLFYDSSTPTYLSAKALRREIRAVINTNGIIEPVDRTEVYAPVDAFVKALPIQEGSEIRRGQLLMRLESQQIRTALAEARAALLQARRQAQAVVSGPPKEELAALDASIAECAMQLDQQNKDLAAEESLLAKQATSRAALETMQNQRDLLKLRLESLRQRRQDLLARYSTEDKQWEQARVGELTREVELLEQQLRAETVSAPASGLIYSLAVKPGAFVSRGTLLAQIYRPGKIRLRAYVDEPDLGKVEEGQQVFIEWDGMPNRKWTGVVEKRAEQVVALNNRSIGYVFCRVDGSPTELIPNLNVKVEIVTARKPNALVVPRAAVSYQNGKPAVMIPSKKGTTMRAVVTGLVTPEEIEILQGLDPGTTVILNPNEVK
jgi:HlyD family secretion protein